MAFREVRVYEIQRSCGSGCGVRDALDRAMVGWTERPSAVTCRGDRAACPRRG